MAIRVRSITAEESDILDRWERGDNIVCYRRARILRLSEAGWRCPAIAEVLALHVETVRWTIKTFNRGGIEAITPQPRSGGRPPGYSPEVADIAADLARQYQEMQDAYDAWWRLPRDERASVPKPPRPPWARYVDLDGAPWIIDDRFLALLDDLVERLQKWLGEV